MNIQDLDNIELNGGVAYILGLVFPLYKEKRLLSQDYILGSVNHNPNKVSQEEINQHYLSVLTLLKKEIPDRDITIKSNKTVDFTLSPKEGFTVLIEKTNISKEECLEILTKKVMEIAEASDKIKQEFVKGCFDGRSSWDKKLYFLAVDVDRDYERQKIIIDIVQSLGVSIQDNTRKPNHPKNDQLRIRKNSIATFMNTIGLYSTCRTKQINDAIGLLGLK